MFDMDTALAAFEAAKIEAARNIGAVAGVVVKSIGGRSSAARCDSSAASPTQVVVQSQPFDAPQAEQLAQPVQRTACNQVVEPEQTDIELLLIAEVERLEAAVDTQNVTIDAHDTSYKTAWAELAQLEREQLNWTPDEAVANFTRMVALRMFLDSHLAKRNALSAELRTIMRAKSGAQDQLIALRIGQAARRDAAQQTEAKRAELLRQLAAPG